MYKILECEGTSWKYGIVSHFLFWGFQTLLEKFNSEMC